jgi:hypothetical protein
MGKVYWKANERQEVVAGFDRPFNTWYAQLYDSNWSERISDDDSPMKTVGYHPSEQALSHPETEHGPYPVKDYDELASYLTAWGIEVPDEIRLRIKEDFNA